LMPSRPARNIMTIEMIIAVYLPWIECITADDYSRLPPRKQLPSDAFGCLRMPSDAFGASKFPPSFSPPFLMLQP
jgi:hypothetical protein